MTIAIGDRLPEATFRVLGSDGIETVTSSKVFGGKKVVLFAVPGAFTPTCHIKHLPGFVESAEEFKKEGVDTVACVAVNDPFVLGAWADASGAKGKVLFLSDGNAEFTKALGLELDATPFGMGLRAKRFALVADNGKVTQLFIEAPGEFSVSSAESVLAAL